MSGSDELGFLGILEKAVSWDLRLDEASWFLDLGEARRWVRWNGQHSKDCVSLSPHAENLKVKKVIKVSYLNSFEYSMYIFKFSICTEIYHVKYSYPIQIICTELSGINYSYLIQKTFHRIIWHHFFISNPNYCTELNGIKYFSVVEKICSEVYGIRYSNLIQIIFKVYGTLTDTVV